MIRTLLFDLDGTLLHMEMDKFLGAYLKSLSTRVAHLMDPGAFAKQLMASTAVMVASDDPEQTNEEVFMADFFTRTGLAPAEALPIFEDFYRTDFERLQAVTTTDPMARQVVETAVDLGYRVVLATNPIFPAMAIHARLRWANVHDLPWTFVASFEEMHFCKPNPRFFTEIAARVGARPEECLMVGNDAQEDLVAGSVGFSTFLATECLIHRGGEEPRADFTGRLGDLRQLLVSGALK